MRTLQWRAVPVRFKGNWPHTCHSSSSKKNTLGGKKEKIHMHRQRKMSQGLDKKQARMGTMKTPFTFQLFWLGKVKERHFS